VPNGAHVYTSSALTPAPHHLSPISSDIHTHRARGETYNWDIQSSELFVRHALRSKGASEVKCTWWNGRQATVLREEMPDLHECEDTWFEDH
jgi:hypothetical protein